MPAHSRWTSTPPRPGHILDFADGLDLPFGTSVLRLLYRPDWPATPAEPHRNKTKEPPPGCGAAPSLAIILTCRLIHRLRLISSFGISSVVVNIRELAWNPR